MIKQTLLVIGAVALTISFAENSEDLIPPQPPMEPPFMEPLGNGVDENIEAQRMILTKEEFEAQQAEQREGVILTREEFEAQKERLLGPKDQIKEENKDLLKDQIKDGPKNQFKNKEAKEDWANLSAEEKEAKKVEKINELKAKKEQNKEALEFKKENLRTQKSAWKAKHQEEINNWKANKAKTQEAVKAEKEK